MLPQIVWEVPDLTIRGLKGNIMTKYCDIIDEERARRAIELSQDDDLEHGFSMCRRWIGPGWASSRMAQGTPDEVDVPEPGILTWGLNCRDEYAIYHTHPPKHDPEPSGGDQAVVDYGPVDAVCSMDYDGNVHCYDGEEIRRCDTEL